MPFASFASVDVSLLAREGLELLSDGSDVRQMVRMPRLSVVGPMDWSDVDPHERETHQKT